MVIMHPPYANFLTYSEKPEDLSKPIPTFLPMFEDVMKNVLQYLDDGRMLVLVIGDMYEDSELKPLGFECMKIVLNHNCRLKAIIVKDFGKYNRQMREGDGLLTYRALTGGYYRFAHEYVMVFQKMPHTMKFLDMLGVDMKSDREIEEWFT